LESDASDATNEDFPGVRIVEDTAAVSGSTLRFSLPPYGFAVAAQSAPSVEISLKKETRADAR
jgi:hypothetical protein